MNWREFTIIVAALALGSYALVGGRTWTGISYGLTALPRATFSGLRRASVDRHQYSTQLSTQVLRRVTSAPIVVVDLATSQEL